MVLGPKGIGKYTIRMDPIGFYIISQSYTSSHTLRVGSVVGSPKPSPKVNGKAEHGSHRAITRWAPGLVKITTIKDLIHG